jgi:hypothetical protein
LGYKIYSLYAHVKHIDPANKAWLKGHKRSRNIMHNHHQGTLVRYMISSVKSINIWVAIMIFAK